jgi:hypothetical protein
MNSKVVVISPAIDVLPFKEILDWKQYQMFCTDVLSQKLGVTDCREYLLQGNRQDGIDIYATEREAIKMTVAQCKLENYTSPGDINNIITEFLAGKFADRVKEFILCTSYDLSKHKDETAIAKARSQLKQKDIDLIIWDQQGLSRYLRSNPLPEIVYHFFKEEVANAFYGEIWIDYIKKMKKFPKQEYKFTDDYIERNVSAYIEYQKKRNSAVWYFSEKQNEKTLTEIFEEPAQGQGTKIILLSIAGFGKTEELKKVAAYYSHEEKPIHPIRYFLKDFEGDQIEALLANYNPNWRNIPPANLLLLFDGLDEVKEQHSQTFVNNLNSFLENNPFTNVLVTSRFNFYDLKQQALRGFDVYFLHPLSQANITNYINKKLGLQKDAFIKKLEENKFSEYLNNPYYLTRLVRFYKEANHTFPKSKTQLFQKILFEQIEKDEVKYNITELKNRLLPVARKIAFCMTLAAKSSLTTDDLKIIVPDEDTRRKLRNFCLLNFNEATVDSWSFEHKNLQEYLCASLMAEYSFDKLQPLISFSFDQDKLLPRFLNTISFLFEILDKGSQLFNDLFNWIQLKQPELFVRFEKEQIEKQTRQKIFKRILEYYKSKKITLRVSPNFYIEDLAEFADIDESIIDFFAQDILDCDNDSAYDRLQLLSQIKKPFLYKEKLAAIYYSVLNSNKFAPYVKGQCIYSLGSVDFNDKTLLEKALKCKIDTSEFEIRRKFIAILEFTSYYNHFADFILDSVSIYKHGQKESTLGGSNETLERLILKLNSAPAVKKVFQYCISHKHTFTQYHRVSVIQFEQEQIKQLLNKAVELYKEDKSFVRLVYRIFVSEESLMYDDKTVAFFVDFFEKTSVKEIIFRKIYRYKWKHGNGLFLANENCIDFLVDEYLAGKISDDDAIIIRNRLSWKNQVLMKYYLNKLNAATHDKFKIEEDPIDYQKLYEQYKEKNQLMLFDKELFLREASEIFDAIPKTDISYDDLHVSENKKLAPYQNSLVKEAITHECVHDGDHLITKDEFLNKFSEDRFWEAYVINEIEDHLKNKNSQPLKPELLLIAKNWLTEKIRITNFAGAIKNNADGGFRYYPNIEFIKQLYLLIDIEVEDEFLLNMLETDYNGIQSIDDLAGVSGKIVKNIKDPALLKSKVIENIRSGNLASWVLATHFNLCHHLKYQECLSDLYAAITSGILKDDHDKRRLTDFYLDLGGEVSDFAAYLKVPVYTREEDHYIQWDWYLIEKFITIKTEKVASILLQISQSPTQGIQGKIKAMGYLLAMGRKEGLDLWKEYIYKHHRQPFEHDTNSFQQYINSNSGPETTEVLIETLDYSLSNRIFSDRSYNSIQEFIYTMLIFISAKDRTAYASIKKDIEALIEKYSKEDFVSQLIYFLERFNQRFYENHEYEISISQSVKFYSELLIGGDGQRPAVEKFLQTDRDSARKLQ